MYFTGNFETRIRKNKKTRDECIKLFAYLQFWNIETSFKHSEAQKP